MALYKVQNTTLWHNGKPYADGDKVELTKEEADKIGEWVSFVKETKTTVPAQPAKTQNKKPEETANKPVTTEGGKDGEKTV